MEQFNRNTYKKQGIFEEFYHSCLGKIIILAILALVLGIAANMSVPNETVTRTETEDNVRQCLQDNDSIKGDVIDEIVWNIGRTFTQADSALDKPYSPLPKEGRIYICE